MYDPDLYKIDSANQYDENASLEDGALLFRITSVSHCDKSSILTGVGAEQGTMAGRFHRVNQRASYCANNILVCLAEILYHMYRRVLDGVKDRQPVRHLDLWSEVCCRLAIVSVARIPDLIYADSQGARVSYAPWVAGSTVVFPDPIYGPLHDFSDRLRIDTKRGVVYPSARHSKDFALVFFRDETSSIASGFYETLPLTLKLVSEKQDLNVKPTGKCRPYEEKLHATIGYYEFTDVTALASCKSRHLLNPPDLREYGYTDFVRRRYGNYPHDAFLP